MGATCGVGVTFGGEAFKGMADSESTIVFAPFDAMGRDANLDSVRVGELKPIYEPLNGKLQDGTRLMPQLSSEVLVLTRPESALGSLGHLGYNNGGDARSKSLDGACGSKAQVALAEVETPESMVPMELEIVKRVDWPESIMATRVVAGF